jgi:tetratricopeptide (TPR) repeat protein
VLGEYKKIEAILLPFLNQPQVPKYEVIFIMGKTYQNLGELNKAIETFDKAISHYGLNSNLLNSIGECYFQLGNAREALTAWEKSLEINPNQPQIKKNVDALKEKK